MVLPALACASVLIATAAVAIAIRDAARARHVVYGICLIASSALLVIALLALLDVSKAPSAVTLPLGIPWLGAHFRLDSLSAFFLAVVALGAAAASLFALGYGRHEPEPGRVLPFYPAFLAGMSIVVLADDAFTFLVSWEFMSLSSWALVMAHQRVPDNVRAGYVYLIMASFGTLALLLMFGLLAGPDGGYAFADIRGDEVWLVGANIAAYDKGGFANHDPERDRKLLLHKREVARLGGKISEKGLTLVPLRLYFKGGRAKVEIGLARGKKQWDKRQALASREAKREIERAVKEFSRA